MSGDRPGAAPNRSADHVDGGADDLEEWR